MEFTLRDAHFTKVADEGASLGSPWGMRQDCALGGENEEEENGTGYISTSFRGLSTSPQHRREIVREV